MNEINNKAVNKSATYTTVLKQSGNLDSGYTKDETDAKFKDVNFLLLGVVIVLLVMVATLIIDSFHINSATYREYSEKINTLNSLNKNNLDIVDINKSNQELIIKQQSQILNLLNKK